MRPPGIRLEDLPHIDLILLSHNHYDHLDIETMQKLYVKFQPKIYTSLGVSAFLNEYGISNSADMDWWEEISIGGNLKLAAVPAQHFSGRGMLDRDATLWCGFVIKRVEGNIYFAADSGYHETLFKEIGGRYAPIRLAMLPIGAYKPRWFMSPIHTSPDEAVKMHIDLKADLSIATHFGTFPLADEGKDEPVADLKAALQVAAIAPEKFIVLEEGRWKDFNQS
jgi:L-ascorbate metabolism protein UlaG (beta-lactamase superfamily)